jgi:D-alanyl-D-alanine carboxypeptidase
MIVVKEFPDRQFATKEELFKELRDNKNTLIAQKKMITKEADSVLHYVCIDNGKGQAVKAETIDTANVNQIKAELVINTTNILDSHSDVHIKGIWNKSAKEQKNLLLLQEHNMTFDKIISDDIDVSVKETKWNDLGFNFKGTTEALTFNANITKARNPFMFEQYSKGYVKEHSVGMRYVKMELALNSESKSDAEEKEIWDKYINEVANKEQAEEQGYFWAILEAKIVEGSAVVKGSNYATPTISIEAVKDTSIEQTEPLKDTQKEEKLLKELLNKF